MKIIHIVSTISKINYGVWNAAIFGAGYLQKKWAVTTELWVCNKSADHSISPCVNFFFFTDFQKTAAGFKKWLSGFDRQSTIIVTHGAWLLPTKLGFCAKHDGYHWIYTPHGMLEPWSLKKGGLKKRLYFELIEKKWCLKADIIRAVSEVEKSNLSKFRNKKIVTIFNGVNFIPDSPHFKSAAPLKFLFLARLHHKKGVLPLVEAWHSVLINNHNFRLIIAGPDEGELNKIRPYLRENIEYLGPIYGAGKEDLLKDAHYYILPSFSEGFPTSVVEAMSFGAIPIISKGCNFPEIFKQKLGYEVGPDTSSIKKVLEVLQNKDFDNSLSSRCIEVVGKYLSDRTIGEQLFILYNDVLR